MNRTACGILALSLIALGAFGEQPRIVGEAAVVIDVDTREIIYQRDIDRRLYPASTTKLLTALLLAEKRQPDHIITYTEEADTVYPYRLDMDAGDRLTAGEAMKALLLFSGNDIAVAIAQDLAGSVSAFSEMMNIRAAKIGMTGSHFVNPTGLHDKDHYTTPYNLSLLARALYDYRWIMEVMPLTSATVTPLGKVSIEVQNRNKLAGVRGCVGGKTGWTTPAGRCLVALYERNGRRIVGVVMRSVLDRADTLVFQDMEALMTWSYAAPRKTAIPAGGTVQRIIESYRPLPFITRRDIVIPLVTHRGVTLYQMAGPADRRVTVQTPINPWRMRLDRSIGTLELFQRERVDRYALYPAVSWLDLIRQNRQPYLFSLILIYSIVAAASALIRMTHSG